MDQHFVLRKVLIVICILRFLTPLPGGFAFAASDLASEVNVFTGTAMSKLRDYGNTLPGAVRPFGMLYWSPDPTDGGFYRWDKPITRGFSLTHTSGPGCPEFGDAPVFPMEQIPHETASGAQRSYRAAFRHQDEAADPGYYSIILDSGIRVRLAAQVRSGIAEFQFPADNKPHVLFFDLGHNLLKRVYAASIELHGGTVTGSVTSGGNCGNARNQYKVYFAFQADTAPDAAVAFGTHEGKAEYVGNEAIHAGGYLSFPAHVRTIRLRVGISYVSTANATVNLRSEIPGWDLELVRREARAAWNDVLGHIEVEGGSSQDRKLLYTALYHASLYPSVFSDVNGEYIGFDDHVHNAANRIQYANFSGWDIYRSEVQLIAMLFPHIAGDMAESLVVDAEQGGGLPVFPVANDEAHAMVGDPSDAILASFYAFGARDFDTRAALNEMLRGADDPNARVNSYIVRPYLDEYLREGYVYDRFIPGRGAASVTLEYQNADFAISRLAAALGNSETSARFLQRSSRWRTLFDPETRYIRARGLDGKFLPNFSPESETGFVEGNSAQYTWMVPYDLESVIESVGGPAAAKDRLDSYFSHYYLQGTANGPFFAIGNEPSFGNPWIYNWTGHPWRTQEVVRKTLRDLFSAEPDGLPGNDDLGATSSWAIFAMLGFYPEIPGVGGVTVHSPVFPSIRLLLGDHTLRINAPGAPSMLYVKRMTLDGVPIPNWWIEWDRLSKAEKLSFDLGSELLRNSDGTPPSFPPALQ